LYQKRRSYTITERIYIIHILRSGYHEFTSATSISGKIGCKKTNDSDPEPFKGPYIIANGCYNGYFILRIYRCGVISVLIQRPKNIKNGLQESSPLIKLVNFESFLSGGSNANYIQGGGPAITISYFFAKVIICKKVIYWHWFQCYLLKSTDASIPDNFIIVN